MNNHLKHLLIGDLTLRRLVRSAFLVATISCIGLAFYTYMFADKIIFQPPHTTYRDSNQIVKLKTADGQHISALYLSHEEATYTILYSHGNAEDLGTVRYKLEELQRMGYAVLGYDYNGYGTSGGTPSESAAYQDIDAAFNHLTRELRVPAERIVLHGWSLGGAVAADLAARRPVAGLILESTFVSAFRVVTRAPILPFDKFRTISKLGSVRCPVLVIHGKQDEVVGFWHGQMLYDEANEPKQHLWVSGAGHGDVAAVAGERYRAALHSFTDLLASR